MLRCPGMERWRIGFGRGEELKFLSHLDLMRLWERAFRRAGLPLAYSQGFSPHPRLSLACPLPLGTTSQGELLEVWLHHPLNLEEHRTSIEQGLPAGITLNSLEVVLVPTPSLASRLREAEYQVKGEGTEVEGKIVQLLSLPSLPWERRGRRYDLRAQVRGIKLLWIEDGRFALEMRLSPSGRPQEVARALGFQPVALHRTRLILE